MSQAFTDLRFFYRGPLASTSGTWEDLTHEIEEEEVVRTFSPGDYSLLFLAGQADDEDFAMRLVQGIRDPEATNEIIWLVVNDVTEELEVTANAEPTPGDGVMIQIGLPVCKVQYKTAAAVNEAIIVGQARWSGR